MQNPGSDAGVFAFVASSDSRNDRRGQHSIRINRQWRVCFRRTRDGPEAIEIVDYH
jgi:plasmid maintenance system killer protein